MFQANQTDYFLKKAKKLVKKNFKLALLIDEKIRELTKNPKNPSLKSHKVVTPKFGEAFSLSVTGDLRIIWDYNDKELFVLDLLDIGSHTGKDKVY